MPTTTMGALKAYALAAVLSTALATPIQTTESFEMANDGYGIFPAANHVDFRPVDTLAVATFVTTIKHHMKHPPTAPASHPFHAAFASGPFPNPEASDRPPMSYDSSISWPASMPHDGDAPFTSNLWPSIKPVVTTFNGATTTVSAFDSTCAFSTKYSATATTDVARPTSQAKNCDDYYVVKPGT